jgi:membrane-associated phospholipid phosphatase
MNKCLKIANKSTRFINMSKFWQKIDTFCKYVEIFEKNRHIFMKCVFFIKIYMDYSMDFETLHHLELQLMTHLLAIRGHLLDSIMLLLNNVDTMPFYSLVIVASWFAYKQKCGVRMLFLFVLCTVINQDCKELFAQPRPFMLQPNLGLLTANSFGFPSGAAQALTVLFGYLALNVRKTWFWVASCLFVLLISFSRVYLGLHFPSDIVGGWVIGAALVAAYYYLEPAVERFIVHKPKSTKLIISILATIILCTLCIRADTMITVFAGFGTAIGLIWTHFLPEPHHIVQRVMRTGFALLGMFILRKVTLRILVAVPLCPMLHISIDALSYFIIGLWFTIGASSFLRKIESARFVK